MNAALLSLGGDIAIASYGVLLYSGGLIQPLIYGQADAMQPAIGYNWGARKKIEYLLSRSTSSLQVSSLASLRSASRSSSRSS